MGCIWFRWRPATVKEPRLGLDLGTWPECQARGSGPRCCSTVWGGRCLVARQVEGTVDFDFELLQLGCSLSFGSRPSELVMWGWSKLRTGHTPKPQT